VITRKRLWLLTAFVLGFIGAYIWLAMWADERNQRFYEASEHRDWGG
jgi:cytochrome c-type biogenesis protein CcmE